jgi:hypothetical protein
MLLQDFTITWTDNNGNKHERLPVLLSNIAVLNVKYNDYYLTISSTKLTARYKYITIQDGYYATIGSRIEYDYLNYAGSERKHIQLLQSMIDTVIVLFKE